MSKTTLIGVRIEPELKQKLQQHADKDNRTLSNLITLIVKQWLESKND